ncbi:peptidase [Membranihabitans maritimus]|uniref:peptidase n=1 Tax=Membranihabitans maritimus TaxID=2904244 RepID=UPI001F1CF1F2|nr:peptidase [Membranihabitans maritimus]
MTYCLGIRVKEGLVAIADTRITSGSETTTAKKISLHSNKHGSLFLMTSGLRSIRDKAVTYFEEVLDEKGHEYEKMYNVVNAFGAQLRRVASEDKEALAASGLSFNLFTIVGGRLLQDKEHKLYLLYPEGNWIEIGKSYPFAIIGNSGYGKPVLKRALNYESSLRFALKTGFLSFDSTRVSANDVGYPIDVVIYNNQSGEMIERRYEESDLKGISSLWAEKLQTIIKEIPEDWIDDINSLSKNSKDQMFISYDQ